MQNMVVVCL